MRDTEVGSFIYCEICNIPFSGIEPYQQHSRGKKHRKRLDEKQFLETERQFTQSGLCSNSENGNYHCNFCKISLNDPTEWNDHVLSAEHQKKALEKEKGNTVSEKEGPSSFRCNVCEKECSGIIPFLQHNKSEQHAKALRKAEALKKIAEGSDDHDEIENTSAVALMDSIASKDFASCNICSKRFGGPESYMQHMQSNVHKKKVGQVALRHELVREKSTSGLISEDTAEGQVDDYQCTDCDKKLSGVIPLMQHLRGRDHHKKLRQKKILEELAPSTPKEVEIEQLMTECVVNDELPSTSGLTCDACKMSFTGSQSARDHFVSKKHLKTTRWINFVAQQRGKSRPEENDDILDESRGKLQESVDTMADATDVPLDGMDREPESKEVGESFWSETEVQPTLEVEDSLLPKPGGQGVFPNLNNGYHYGPKIQNVEPDDKTILIDNTKIYFPKDSLGIVVPTAPSLNVDDGDDNDAELPSYDSIAKNSGGLFQPNDLANDVPKNSQATSTTEDRKVPGSKGLYPQLPDDEMSNVLQELQHQAKDESPGAKPDPSVTEGSNDLYLNSSDPGDSESETTGSDGQKKKKKKSKCKGFRLLGKKALGSLVNILD